MQFKQPIGIVTALIVGGLAATWWSRRAVPPPVPMGAVRSAVEVIQNPEVTISPEALERIHLKFARVTEGTQNSDIRVPATVQPNTYHEVHVTPVTGGIVTQVTAELGQAVKRGQPLAQIFSRELAEAQAALVSTQAELDAEHKKLERTQELVRLGAASREELETVEASHKVHSAHLEEARQRLEILGRDGTQQQGSSTIVIPAPLDGIVTARSVNAGQVVSMGQELFTVTDLSTVWVEGSLLENDFATVRTGSRATITTPAYPERTWHGNVTYIEPRVDPQTRTAKVRVELDNAGGALRPGMYMDMTFESPGGTKVAIVPKEAIQQTGTASVVYVPVKGESGRFIERRTEELKAGDTVVTEGSFLLRAEALRQRVTQ